MNKHEIRYGVMAGLAAVVLMLLFYFVDAKMMLEWSGWLTWIIFIFAMVKAGLDTRADSQGFISWGESLKATWITYGLASLFLIAFQYVLMNFIDPSLIELQKEMALEIVEKAGRMIGASEEMMEEMMEQASADASGFSISTALVGWGFGLFIPGFIFAAIISLIIRKDRPAGAYDLDN